MVVAYIQTFRSARFHRLFKESFWVVLGQAVAVIGALVGVRLLTELLTPASYGELALGMAVATLINQTVLGPLSNGANRFYAPAQEQGDLGSYLDAVRRLVLSATGIIVLMILLTVAGLLIVGRTEWIAIAIAAIIFATLSGYNAILSGIQNAARQRAIVALHQGMEFWVRFLVAAGLLLWLGASSTVAMVGYALAVLPVIGSQYVFFRKIVPKNVTGPFVEIKWREQMLKYSWPFASWGIFYWAQSASDRWALEVFSTTREVGLYAVLFQLGYQPVSMATGMAVQLLSPILYQRAGDATDSQRNANVNNLSWRLTWVSLGVTGATFFVALIFHAQIFWIFVAKDYASISYLLPWMVLAGGIFAAGQVMSLNLMSQMKTHAMVWAKIATAILGIIFNFVGAYFIGIEGIVFAGVLFSVLYAVWMAILSRRIAGGSLVVESLNAS